MLVRDLIAKLQEVDPDEEVRAFIFEKQTKSDLQESKCRFQVKEGFEREWHDKGDLTYLCKKPIPRCFVVLDGTLAQLEDFSKESGQTMDGALLRLVSIGYRSVREVDRKKWRTFPWTC